MDENQKKLLEEDRAKRETIYQEAVQAHKEELKETHTLKEYTFSLEEKRRLFQQEGILAFSRQAIKDIINSSVLPRIGIQPMGVSVVHDASVGKLAVFIPKNSKGKVPSEDPAPSEPVA